MTKWLCETCVCFPPSSCGGKPCSFCDPEDPSLSCYTEKEILMNRSNQIVAAENDKADCFAVI